MTQQKNKQNKNNKKSGNKETVADTAVPKNKIVRSIAKGSGAGSSPSRLTQSSQNRMADQVTQTWKNDPSKAIKPEPATTLSTKKETIMKEKIEKITGDTFVKVDEITKIVQENTDAYLKFVSRYAKGLEEVRQSYFDYSRAAFEKSAEASKELLSAKTVGEFTEKQSKFAQDALNEFVTESTKLSEKTMKVTTEAAEPLKTHIEKTVENVSKKIAA